MKNLIHDDSGNAPQSSAPSISEPKLAIDPSLIPPHQDQSVPIKQSVQKESTMQSKKLVTALILVVAVLSGIGTGYGLYTVNGKSANSPSEEAGTTNLNVGSPKSDVEVGQTYGSPNESDFKDSTEGIIQPGEKGVEGTHVLIRPGGVSQTVHMTSSVVDMDKFVGAKVKVWGETMGAQKVGWLMDVGRIKVLELNAPLPEE